MPLPCSETSMAPHCRLDQVQAQEPGVHEAASLAGTCLCRLTLLPPSCEFSAPARLDRHPAPRTQAFHTNCSTTPLLLSTPAPPSRKDQEGLTPKHHPHAIRPRQRLLPRDLAALTDSCPRINFPGGFYSFRADSFTLVFQ